MTTTEAEQLARDVAHVASKRMPTDPEELLARIDELKHACLASIGYLNGQSIASRAQICATLVEAVKLSSEPYPSKR